VLGQPLDFAVQLRLGPGEAVEAACVGAEVTLGDRRMPAALVHTRLEMTGADSARVRVLTAQAVNEPVAGVRVDVHCPMVRLSRSFVVFADPPLFRGVAAAAAYAPAFAADLPEVPTPPPRALAPAAEPVAAAGAAAVAAGALADGGAPVASAAPGAGTESPRHAGAGQARTEAVRGAAARPHRPHRRAAAPGAQRTRRARPASPATAATAAPRLRLEAVVPVPSPQAVAIDEALEAVAQAASAARVAASAAATDAARIASLERTVEALRADVASNRDAAALLRERLAQADQTGRWIWPLLALVLVVTGLAAWLAWRLNIAQAERQLAWHKASRTPPAAPESELTPSKLPTAPIPFVTSEVMLPARPGAPARARAAWPAPAAPDSVAPPSAAAPSPAAAVKSAAPGAAPGFEYDDAMQRTEPLPAQGALGDAAPRDVTIEELIDLEQQAEFFVVLGQDDAAIELLVEHLRQTGGGSPLPYLKLLEIYRRRGDRSDYERLRTRFNQRFNAYAPGWDADLQGGRTLESYPGVVPRLQQVWSRPLDAMAELEALLFRKSRGDLFELPAYREVLLLYSLARDLMDREGADTGSVDLLLPLADGGEFSSTSPAPFLVSQRDGAPGHEPQASATAPVDFDISADANGPSSIFGPLGDGERRARNR
jgi:hypothetical protein